MGTQDVNKRSDTEGMHQFLKYLLADLEAFETMVREHRFEEGIRRIGAEQELFLVDDDWRPAPLANEILKRTNDDHYTNELALFNLEYNLDPLVFGGDCLSRLENEIDKYLVKVRKAAKKCNGKVIMVGILPTLHKSHLGMENMTPNPRYYALNDALTKLRGGPYQFQIKGVDEVNVFHDSVMVEACNTSFQVHFQVGVDEFAKLYNIAQTIAAPVMSVAANSPVLFGRRLWRETRIALFQQSIDTRKVSPHLREQSPRVRFGANWVKESPVEIFREDISRNRSILSTEIDEDPFEALAAGRAPTLKALRLHNSTIYRWNRICYGISDNGKPHLRIENRILPAGPTPRDEMANAAFWFGLMSGFAQEVKDVRDHFRFEDVKANFFAAAQHGLNAQLQWSGKTLMPVRRLITSRLLPLAEQGLKSAGIDEADIDKYFDVIRQRVRNSQTGSQWLLSSFDKMKDAGGTLPEKMSALTAAMESRQLGGTPVHTWKLASIDESGGWAHNYMRTEQYMSTNLVTVHEHEPIELVANLMDWNKIRHILVEDDQNRLVGVVSHRALIRKLGRVFRDERDDSMPPVSEIMRRDPLTITPETPTLDAIRIMRDSQISCLPVIKDGRLVGVVTDSDFMTIAASLMEQQLKSNA